MIDLASFRLALVLLCLECFCAGVAIITASWWMALANAIAAAIFYVIVYFNARHALSIVGLARAEQSRAEQKQRLRRFLCAQRGCTQTDGKPCAFAECPNRGERP